MKVKYSDLKNKRIFITGGGSGIGASIVEHFCEQGSAWMLGEGDKVAYETAKSAVIGLTRSFAREFGKYNIRCNSVTPGSIATERQIKHWLTPKYKKFILDKQCLKRQLKPADVASLVVHLSSDVSSGCTKQNFIIDAGIT